MKIKLNEVEQRLAKFIAKKRYQVAREAGVYDNKLGDQSNWETDLEGIAGEIAYCKHKNCFPDLELKSYGYYDCIDPEIGTVDVKTTKYKTGKLLAVKGKALKDKIPDAYVLMIGEFPEYEYKGWATSNELLNNKNLQSLNGKSEGFVLSQDKLRR